MLQLQSIDKKLGYFQIKDISFHLPKGYIMGLIGPNGAGKTTLIHMMLGLIRPDEGEILIDGKAYSEFEKENKEAVGYVLAERLFDYALPIYKMAKYFGQFYDAYEERVFLEYAKTFELDVKKRGNKLSKGESIKFQTAFALAHQPKLLILDEPTANFDPEFRKKFLKLLSQFVSDGEHSILISTHLTGELDRLADYVTFIDQGKLIFSKDKESLLEEYRIVSGEKYKINLLKKERVIYREDGVYATKALVKGDRFEAYDKCLSLEIPNIEEIMYFTVKGRGNHS